jgi:hypothetical protein
MCHVAAGRHLTDMDCYPAIALNGATHEALPPSVLLPSSIDLWVPNSLSAHATQAFRL